MTDKDMDDESLMILEEVRQIDVNIEIYQSLTTFSLESGAVSLNANLVPSQEAKVNRTYTLLIRQHPVQGRTSNLKDGYVSVLQLIFPRISRHLRISSQIVAQWNHHQCMPLIIISIESVYLTTLKPGINCKRKEWEPGPD